MARARGGRSSSHHGKHQRTHAPTRTHTDHRSQAAARVSSKARASGPSSIHDVYQFLTSHAGDDGTSSAHKGKGKGKGKASSAEKRLKRALVNDAADEDADVRRGGGGGGGGVGGNVDSDQEAGASTAASGSRGQGFLDVNSEEENGVLEEDDEEIDSDEAWDEADEHRFADLLPVSNRASKRKRADDDDDDDDDDDEAAEEEGEISEDDGEVDDEDMVDISRMLQDSDEDDDAATQSDSGVHEDNSDDDDDDDDDGNHTANALQRRMAALAAVDTSKAGPHPDDDDDDDDERPEGKRRLLAARTEAVPESAYSAAGSGGHKVRVEDLLAGLGQTGASYTDLRNTAKTLSDVKRAHARDGSGGGGASKRKGAPLQAPLPSILQDRIDRAAAHEQSKAEVEGWAPTIKRLREAEHLSFPLQDDKMVPQSVAALTSSENVKPTNDMERSIAALLAQEGMTDRNVGKAEELAMNERGMDREQIKKRREELRHMRELLFREEQKAKRVRKIKSKTYRKIARKQRERQKASEKEAGLGSGGEEEEEEEEDRMEAERDRAMERATLKHKNTGRWAKNLVGKHATMENVEARNAIEEQLLRGERLRRRIQGVETDDEAEESDSDDADQPDEDPFDELRRLQGQEEEVAPSSSSGKKAAVWDMKFMSDARKRDAQQRRDEVDDFEREMAALDKQGVGEHEENRTATMDGVRSSVQGNVGRATYAPKQARGAAASTDRRPTQASQSRGANDKETLQPSAFESSKPILVSQPKSSVAQSTSVEPGAAAAAAAANPWMSSTDRGSKVSRKKNETLVAKDASALDRAANRMQRHRAKGEEGRMSAEDDARLEIDPEARLRFAGAEIGESALAASAKRPSQADEPDIRQHGSAGSDSDSDSESGEPALVSAQRNASRGGEIRIPGALQQRDLVAEAFAGDDVAAEFEADKKAIMERDAPKEVDETLPGWGSWGGKGVKKARGRGQQQQRKYTRTIAGLEASQRKDANMKGVIINEKRDKKADKFKAKDLPFPYTSAAQYQLAMQNPIGPEWNTRTTHQRLTLPRVVTKPGKAILPIQRKF